MTLCAYRDLNVEEDPRQLLVHRVVDGIEVVGAVEGEGEDPVSSFEPDPFVAIVVHDHSLISDRPPGSRDRQDLPGPCVEGRSPARKRLF